MFSCKAIPDRLTFDLRCRFCSQKLTSVALPRIRV